MEFVSFKSIAMEVIEILDSDDEIVNLEFEDEEAITIDDEDDMLSCTCCGECLPDRKVECVECRALYHVRCTAIPSSMWEDLLICDWICKCCTQSHKRIKLLNSALLERTPKTNNGNSRIFNDHSENPVQNLFHTPNKSHAKPKNTILCGSKRSLKMAQSSLSPKKKRFPLRISGRKLPQCPDIDLVLLLSQLQQRVFRLSETTSYVSSYAEQNSHYNFQGSSSIWEGVGIMGGF